MRQLYDMFSPSGCVVVEWDDLRRRTNDLRLEFHGYLIDQIVDFDSNDSFGPNEDVPVNQNEAILARFRRCDRRADPMNALLLQIGKTNNLIKQLLECTKI